MNAKHRKTLELVFKVPTPANIKWRDIESLYAALGATITERAGSRVAISLNGVVAIFHRPHPQPTAKRGVVRAVKDHLTAAGVNH